MAIANETISGRPECAAYTAGRIFYGLDSIVYYSQLLEGQSLSQIDKCYQQNDPTAEQLSDVLDTDGGTIPINGADRIIQLVEYLQGVLVFSTNGVWQISGPETGFKATDYYVKQISDQGLIGIKTVVKTNETVIYWSRSGIYQISPNQYGQLSSESITENTIQTHYNSIGDTFKAKAKGVYLESEQKIQWLYNSNAGGTVLPDFCDMSLTLDLRTGGWFKDKFESEVTIVPTTHDISLAGAVLKSKSSTESEMLYVYTSKAVSSPFSVGLAFATKTDGDFEDFGSQFDTAYLDTGYETLGKPSNKKVAPYVTTHFKQTETAWVDLGGGDLDLNNKSSCLVSTKWDWNDTNANGRFGPSQEAYRFRRFFMPTGAGAFNSGETVITSKIKVRGRGKSLSVRFEQSAGKDFQLLGYSIQYSMKGGM